MAGGRMGENPCERLIESNVHNAGDDNAIDVDH